MRLASALLLLLPLLCTTTQSGIPPGSKLPEQLSRAEERWKAKGPRTYRYTIEMDCLLCAPPVQVVVVNGKCVTAKPIAPHSEPISCTGRTIPELFKTIRTWVEDTSGSTIEVIFDESDGHPITSFIQTNIEHETERYRIDGFKAAR